MPAASTIDRWDRLVPPLRIRRPLLALALILGAVGVSADQDSPPWELPVEARVLASITCLNLRLEASVLSASTTCLPAGSEVTVLENVTLWSRVRTDTGTQGWVATRFLELLGESEGAAGPPARSSSADDTGSLPGNLAESRVTEPSQLDGSPASEQASQVRLEAALQEEERLVRKVTSTEKSVQELRVRLEAALQEEQQLMRRVDTAEETVLDLRLEARQVLQTQRDLELRLARSREAIAKTRDALQGAREEETGHEGLAQLDSSGETARDSQTGRTASSSPPLPRAVRVRPPFESEVGQEHSAELQPAFDSAEEAPGRRVAVSRPIGARVDPAKEATGSDAGRAKDPGGEAVEASTPGDKPIPRPHDASELPAVAEAWAKAWADQRVKDYLSYYARDFIPSNAMARDAWEAQRKDRLTRPARIEVRISSPRVEKTIDGAASLLFAQAYEADIYRDEVVKRLDFVWEDQAWKIRRESVVRIIAQP